MWSLLEKLLERKGLTATLLVGFFLGWVLTAVIALLFFLCIRGVDVDSLPVVDFFRLDCGCEVERNQTAHAVLRVDSLIRSRDSLLTDYDKTKKDLEVIQKGLNASDGTNKVLAAQLDSVRKRLALLEGKLKLADKAVAAAESIKNLQNANGDTIIVYKTSRFDSLKIDSLSKRNNILEHVYITDIKLQGVDKSRVLVGFTLLGVKSLKANGYANHPPVVELRIYNRKTSEYVEYIEKSPKDDKNKNNTAPVPIVYDNAAGDTLEGTCYFINIQDKPFEKGLLALLSTDFFNLEFYIDGFTRPLSYYPSKIKKLERSNKSRTSR